MFGMGKSGDTSRKRRKRFLGIGSPNPCPPTHWFRAGVEGKDIVDKSSLTEAAA
jgi:hypothetical protein